MAMKKHLFLLGTTLLTALLNSCASNPSVETPPFNNFEQPKSQVTMAAATGAATGATVGAIAFPGGSTIGAIAGGVVGGVTHAVDATNQESPKKIMAQLPQEHIQVVNDGDTITLLVPTDNYDLPDSYEFDDVWYRGLDYIAQLVLKTKTNQVIYVAGFSDGGIGSPEKARQLSQQRAQQMADFLWANGVPLSQLSVEGYGAKYDIANNFLIHGAAMNRRIEIQWRMCNQ